MEMTMVYVYGIMFAVVTVVHLFATRWKVNSLRWPTKPVILLSILGFYLEWTRVRGIAPSGVLVAALLTAWLGDILLIPSGDAWFTAGGVSFGAAHVLFILSYAESGIAYSALSLPAAVLPSVLFAAAVLFIFLWLRAGMPAMLKIPLLLYLLCNGVMNCFAWFRLLSGACPVTAGLISVAGAALFFLSDSVLFAIRFGKPSRFRCGFTVMLTYALGVFLIVLGLMLAA